MSIQQTKPITERDPGPYGRRPCEQCGVKLTSYNPGPLCAQCNGGDWGATKVTVLHTLDDLADVMAA